MSMRCRIISNFNSNLQNKSADTNLISTVNFPATPNTCKAETIYMQLYIILHNYNVTYFMLTQLEHMLQNQKITMKYWVILHVCMQIQKKFSCSGNV